MKSLFLIASQRFDHIRLGRGTLKTVVRVVVGHCGVMNVMPDASLVVVG